MLIEKVRNHKQNGEKGERIAIGELSKYDIDIALPMSDNHSYDFIVICNDKFYKVQVKSSEWKTDNYIEFTLKKNNWYKKTSKRYTKEDADVFVLCDYNNIYLLNSDEFSDKGTFSMVKIKTEVTCRKYEQHLAEDFIISKDRISKVFI